MFQIFIRDICTSRGGTYKIEITKDMTMDEFKKKVFLRTQLPSLSQKFKYNTKYLNNEKKIFEQIDFGDNNWVTIELMFRLHGPGCRCISCIDKVILRSGKRINRI